jgi:hypothetical protein
MSCDEKRRVVFSLRTTLFFLLEVFDLQQELVYLMVRAANAGERVYSGAKKSMRMVHLFVWTPSRSAAFFLRAGGQ